MKAKATFDAVDFASHEALPSATTFTGCGGHKQLIEKTLQAVAHEIRNPLVVIGAYARKLVDASDSDSDSGRYAKVILERTVKLERVLSVMIDKNIIEDA